MNRQISHLRSARILTLFSLLPLWTQAQESHEDEHHILDEITVLATPLARTVQQLSQPTTVLEGEQLARKQSTSVGETVSQELGVSSSFFGPVASRPVIRGQFGERVRVLSNGLDSLDASALSDDHQVSVDGLLAQRIEIVRGPATLLYGSGAAGGLVNVVDNRITEQPHDAPVSGGVAASADSAVGKRDLAAQVNLGSQRFTAHFDYMRRETNDYAIPGFAESAALRALEDEAGEEREEAFGIVENSDSSSEAGGLGLSLTGDRGYLGVSAAAFLSEYGIPGGHGHESTGGAEEESSARIDLDQRRFELRGEYEIGRAIETGKVLVASTDYEHVELEDGAVGTVFQTKGTEARLEMKHRKFGDLDGAFGLQHKRIDFDAEGDEAYVPPSLTTESSVFVFEEWSVSETFTLQASARIEAQRITTPASAADYDDTAYGASAGAIWRISQDQRIAANLAYTQRHPNATELYADGPHVAVQRFERGTVTQGSGILDKEKSSNVDVTWRGDTGKVEWAVTAFVNIVDDYILLAPTADIEDDLQVFEYRQGDAELYGYEAEVRFELSDTSFGHWHTRVFSDLVRGEVRKTGENLTRIPPQRYGGALHYTFGSIETALELIYHAAQTRVAENELETPSYTMVNADLSYAIDEAGFFFFLRGTNLGNRDARQHSSPLKDLVPLPGRSIHFGIRYAF